MGGQGKSSNSSSNSMQRVKLYRLSDDGKWDDQGTGHVTVEYMEGSKELGLLVLDEEDNETLLAHCISPDDIYRRQEDTIISWRDPELATELALSFQEATGCSYIWYTFCYCMFFLLHTDFLGLEVGPRPAMDTLEPSRILQSNEGSFRSVNSDLRELPPVDLSSLPLLLKTILECNITDQMRVAELISQDSEFFPKLVDIFRMSEDLDNIDGLHMMYRLVRGIILLNNPTIFDRMFSDDCIMDIIGALEYDPEVPKAQNHRAFLKEHVVFKEAIPIKNNSVLTKIHQSYRVGYIKDVILPRALDDATIASLNSIIHSNNAVVISLLKDDSCFIQELFAKMKSDAVSCDSKRDLVLFLHEFCSLSKSLQLVQQLRLFRDLANEGIFDIIVDVLQSHDKKIISAGTDILILFLNQDPNLLRSFIIQQEGNTLLGLLVKGMITDFGEDMHCQFLEIIRILIDSYTMSGSQKDAIIDIFYENYLDQLVDVIAQSCSLKKYSQGALNSSTGPSRSNESDNLPAKSEILMNICELLCFCVVHHPYRIKCSFLINNAIEKILTLTRSKERFLVVAVVRFMRTIISRNDEHLLRHIVKNNLLKPIIDVFCENGNRYNMLHSGVLELLEYIRKDNLKSLVVYVVETFSEQLRKFEHLGSIQALKIKYDQCLENNGEQKTENNAKGEARKRAEDRGLDKEEEDYFNEDSDEEDSAGNATHRQNRSTRPKNNRVPNGTKANYPSTRPITAGLVDYEDDEDDEDYNPPPPPAKKHEDSLIDENAPLNISKHKRKPSSNSTCDTNQHHDIGDVVAKKPKLEARLTSSKIAILTKKDNQVDEPTSDKPVDVSIQTEKESNGNDFSNSESTTENEGKTENKVEVNHNAQLPDDCSTPLSNSEPYPVR
ncbi:serine/threonine-protein phosphatase 4 regulatory subunit 3B-like isoform X1 [Carex littledalei]|uniref:Serine/threonine-protein phosphatase 4 regulatory subunit 3B-like isoform X1 n=1 Tax=Carex littledalei TaxID=544730 RepID=A0A833R399_9POAL|nr:serine/threonine-protein phosphatase 4 regulatory subunit 3B-like isoform X1 [Carex littledalei]